MRIDELLSYRDQIYRIAAKHHIAKVYVFGSVARRDSDETSDVDFLVDMEAGASSFGIGGFQYEIQKLLKVNIDVVPSYVLPQVDDLEFVQNIRNDAVAL